ncbi:MAG: small ribosomal subunit biogenesis GTPase RsgA [Magnetococcales bacterium]|nr:small ribosomal subunit biogenesis GTPase RsgA [Magnetococcales bacterium]
MPRKRGKNRLTQRQQARIQAIQQRRLTRKQTRQKEQAETLAQGEMGEQQQGLVISHYGLNVEVQADNGASYRCAVRETLRENPVCGDGVLWHRVGEDQGVIVAMQPRGSILKRPGAYGRIQTIAVNVDRIMVVTTALDPKPGLLDRYLVAASAAGIEAVIVINKMDLAPDEEDLELLAEILSPYQKMDYPIVMASAASAHGLNDLEMALSDHTSVFVGLSGVGKSSLIDHFIPHETLKTAPVHEATGQGRHTTTVSRLYGLPNGGRIIDSPGVRAFALWGLEGREVARHFRDIAPYLGRCRFSDCTHRHEPGCAVLEALSAGEIDPYRVESMYRITDSIPETVGSAPAKYL